VIVLDIVNIITAVKPAALTEKRRELIIVENIEIVVNLKKDMILAKL
jgi:hypothetical protein